MNPNPFRPRMTLPLLALAALCATACTKMENPWDESDDKELNVVPPKSLFANKKIATEFPPEKLKSMSMDEKLAMGRGFAETDDKVTAEPLLVAAGEDALRLGDKDPRKCEVLNEVAYFFYFRGLLPKAELWFRRLVDARKKLDGGDTPDLAYDVLKVANLKAFGSQYDQSLVEFEEAMRVIVASAPNHPKRREIHENVLRDYVAMLQKSGMTDKIDGVNQKYAYK